MAEATDGRAVADRVRAAHHALRAARVAESLLLGAAGAGVVQAAAVVSGAPPSATSLGVAAGCGLAVALACALAQRRTVTEVARALDRRLGFGGALFTAWELEAEARPPALVAALAPRVAARVSRRAAQRALLPRSGPLVALPFVAAALVVLALDLERAADPRRELELRGARLVGAGRALGAMVDAPEAPLDAEQRAALHAVAARAGGLGRGGAAALESPALRDLLDDAIDLAGRLPLGSPQRRELEEMQADVQSALAALALQAPAEGAAPAAAGGSLAVGGGPEQGGLTQAAQAEPLTPGAAEGRMRGRPEAGELSAPPSGAGAGLAVPRPVPPEHAGLVARWLERRAASPSR